MQVVSASGSVEISGNNLTGGIELNKFDLSVKWSKIGNLETDMIEVRHLLPLIS